MRILFIHEVNYRNKVIFEMHEFPELLALRGHEVSFFHYPESPDQRQISLRTTREVIPGRVHPDASITLITPPTLGGRSWERYFAPLGNLPSLRRELRSGRYDIVVLYSVPTTGWQATGIAKRAKIPLVFRALDVSHKIRRNVLSDLIRRAEGYVYREATLLSANNPALADYCVEESGRTGETVVNLAPVDLSHFTDSTETSTAVRAKLGFAESDRVIMYMGTFFDFSGLDTLLTGLVPEFAAHPELRLLLVGGGELDVRLRSMAIELGVEDRVVFTGVIPYAELPGYLQAADVAVNPFVPQLLTDVAFPHKVLQYMAAGVPAVSTSLRGLRGVLGEDAGVTWVPLPSDVARAATDLALDNPAVRVRKAKLQRDFVTRVFNKESATDSFENTLKALC